MIRIKLFLTFISFLISLSIIFVGCTPAAHQLTTSVVPNGGGTISPAEGIFQGSVTLVATPAQYYQFTGWAGSASGNTNPLTVTMNSDEQIVAQFTKIQYTVQVTSNTPNGGTVSPSGGSYDAGSTITLNATPANGYTFLNWGTGATGNKNPLSILVNGNMNITANFIPQYALAVSADPSEGTINSNGGVYNAGAKVNLTATPIFPCAFENWVGADNNNANPTTVTMNINKTVSATFVKEVAQTQTPIQKGDHIYNGNGTVPVPLTKSEWISGSITVDIAEHVYILGPDGTTVKDFGTTKLANFEFMAPSTGTYTIVVPADYFSTFGTTYTVTYTVYGPHS